VHKRSSVVNERGILRRHGEHIAEVVGVGKVERTGRVVHAVLVIAAGGRELLIVGVALPDLIEDGKGIGGSARAGGLAPVLPASGGQRQGHDEGKDEGKCSFHVVGSP